METNWLWDKDVTEAQAKAVLADTRHPQFISYAALILSRSDSAREVFSDYLTRQNFFSFWTKIKKQMRKDAWNNPRIEYWQAIYETLKKEMPGLRASKIPTLSSEFASVIPKEVGRKVQIFREQLGWTQEKLAERLGISQQIISRIESGNQNVSVETLNNICVALGIPFEKFFLMQPDLPQERLNVSPFSSKSPEEFVKLVFEIVNRSKEFDQPEFWDGTGDKQRDIVAFRYNQVGKKERWVFQCKRYASISFSVFQNELDKISEFSGKETVYKPDVIVFATACKVSAYCKDKVKNYAERIGFPEVYFWTDVELITKAKALGIYDDFFSITKKDLKESSKDIKEHVTALFTQAGLLVDQDKSKKDDINKAIDAAVQEIHKGNYSKAKVDLRVLEERVVNLKGDYSSELSRVYNNLGVCFNRIESDGRDVFQAEKYFILALEKNPGMLKAKINLAAVHLNKGTPEDIEQAHLKATDLWDGAGKKEPAIYEVLMWAKLRHKSAQEAISFYEKSMEAQKLVSRHEKLLNMTGAIYLGNGDIDKAGALVDEALKLSPDAPHNLLLKAKVLMSYAEKYDIDSSDPYEVRPIVKKTDNINKAVECLNKGLDGFRGKEGEKNRFLEAELRYDLCFCLLLLRRHDDPEYKENRKSIEADRLNPALQKQLEIHDALLEIPRRNPEIAYSLLMESKLWPELSYKEKGRLAHIFFLEGFPQYSKKIFSEIESEAEKQKDFLFYLDMSMNEVLLNDKTQAIQYVERAREYAKNTPQEKRVLSHRNALMFRYARDNETDRLISGLFEYDAKYPKDKAIQSFKVIEEDGKVSEEFKTILLKQKEWYENVKQKFRDEPVPSYFLEKILHRTYIEILSYRGRDELDFFIPLTVVEKSFEENLLDSFERTDNLVFDYASMLNLSKMNLLGYLEKLGKGIYVSKKLFDKIQYELLQFEQEDLRNLWRFLKDSKTIQLEKIVEPADSKYSKLLDPWLAESVTLAKDNQAVFVIDDLRLLNFFQSEEGIKGCNTLIILKSLLKKEWIDSKIYATSIGDLAERFYTFLPFSGDDLFQIVMEDKAKISLRSYHLVSQLFLPGSVVTSFTSVFVRFVDLLWKTGSLPEDKLNWITFLTDKIMDFIDRQGGISNQYDLEQILPDFIQIWIIAVQRSSKDEILLIDNKLDETFKLPAYSTLKDNLSRFVKAKKVSLGIAS